MQAALTTGSVTRVSRAKVRRKNRWRFIVKWDGSVLGPGSGLLGTRDALGKPSSAELKYSLQSCFLPGDLNWFILVGCYCLVRNVITQFEKLETLFFPMN